jgi:hypothetical protein
MLSWRPKRLGTLPCAAIAVFLRAFKSNRYYMMVGIPNSREI